MTNSPSSVRVGLEDERSLAGPFTGLYQTIGTPLDKNPVLIIFDNQSDVAVGVGNTGTSIWKTFSAGQCFVMDARANHGMAYDYTFPIGTQFYGIGTAGTGSFRISITFAE